MLIFCHMLRECAFIHHLLSLRELDTLVIPSPEMKKQRIQKLAACGSVRLKSIVCTSGISHLLLHLSCPLPAYTRALGTAD